ncbi:MAG: nickel pincer cofactor biosynthesis protein LarB [Chloroflexi bacterium]|nr:nickel pincer cofactor biosynthesis protein LarB [Chloroflexota bacterium]
MGDERLLRLLSQVRDGQLPVVDALEELRRLPYEDLGFAKIDHHRALRQGLPEVILGHGKTVEQVAAIAERLASRADRLLITRVGPECYTAIQEILPDAVYHPTARVITVNRMTDRLRREGVLLLSGGTADMPVAEEAAVTAELMDCVVERIYDVGVAGIHRLMDHLPRLWDARVVIVVAGMEGALPSVVAGLVGVPVIAVPTSIGYGASFGGLAPLLTMLNSCATGICVVNIDNGFGAGYLAALMTRE